MTKKKSTIKEKKAITEDDGIHREWYEKARAVTLKTLPKFMRSVVDAFEHDYGTVCHAIAASAIAAAWAANRMEGADGGITGFQASCVAWEIFRNWMGEKGPLGLMKFENMLFPQYEDRFQNTISASTWKWLQEQATERLAHTKPPTSPAVLAHWKLIVAGKVPFGYTVETEKEGDK